MRVVYIVCPAMLAALVAAVPPAHADDEVGLGVPPPPPVVVYTPPPLPQHAPKNALWVGGRASFVTLGGAFFDNEHGDMELASNFARSGLGLEANVGARLSRRYVPYAFYEHGFLRAGHRFVGSDGAASSDYYGIGLRATLGEPDGVGLLTDLAIGYRSVHVSNAGASYSMSTLEFFRFGLGAEVRLSTEFVLSPLATLSTGMMSDTSGTVAYSAEGSTDGVTQPRYVGGQSIDRGRSYFLVTLGVGGHFDLLGK